MSVLVLISLQSAIEQTIGNLFTDAALLSALTFLKRKGFAGDHNNVLSLIRLGHFVMTARSVFVEGRTRREVLTHIIRYCTVSN